MEKRILEANERVANGRRAAAQIRKSGRIPAVMYDGHGKSSPIDVDEREFMRLFKAITESTIVKVSVGGQEHEVFIKDYQHNIVTDKIEHVDFYEVERGKLLRTKVQIRLEGSPEGVRHGGVLESGITELEVECLPQHLPPRIIVDVSNLDVNEALHVSDIKLPDTVTILTSSDTAVAAIKFIAAEISESSEEEEEEEVAGEETKAEEAGAGEENKD